MNNFRKKELREAGKHILFLILLNFIIKAIGSENFKDRVGFVDMITLATILISAAAAVMPLEEGALPELENPEKVKKEEL